MNAVATQTVAVVALVVAVIALIASFRRPRP